MRMPRDPQRAPGRRYAVLKIKPDGTQTRVWGSSNVFVAGIQASAVSEVIPIGARVLSQEVLILDRAR